MCGWVCACHHAAPMAFLHHKGMALISVPQSVISSTLLILHTICENQEIWSGYIPDTINSMNNSIYTTPSHDFPCVRVLSCRTRMELYCVYILLSVSGFLLGKCCTAQVTLRFVFIGHLRNVSVIHMHWYPLSHPLTQPAPSYWLNEPHLHVLKSSL